MPDVFPPLAPLDVVKVTLQALLAGQEVQNNFYYEVSAIDETDPEGGYAAMGAGFNTDVWLSLREQLSNQVSGVRFRIQKILPSPKYAHYNHVPALTNGVVVAPSLPPSVAVVIRGYGIQAHRTNRCRKFLFGIPDTSVAFGRLTTEVQPEFDIIADSLLVGPVTEGQWTFRSIMMEFPPAPGIPVRRTILAAEVDPVVRSQRRREVGVGQ